jgi:hypothetical protein
MAETHEITGYEYYVFSSRDANEANAVVLLDGDEGYLGSAFFSNDPTTPLKPAEKFENGIVGLYYKMSDLPVIIDMLRNERPASLIFDGPQNSRISTTSQLLRKDQLSGLA